MTRLATGQRLPTSSALFLEVVARRIIVRRCPSRPQSAYSGRCQSGLTVFPLRPTWILVEIVVVVKIAGLRTLITAIAIATDMVQHPRNNPVVPSRCAGPIIPFACWSP